MQDDLIPERLIIVEPRTLIRESLLALFLNTNVFPSIHLAQDGDNTNFQTKWGATTVFLVAGSSYPRMSRTVLSIQASQPDSTIVILDEHFRSGGGLLVCGTKPHGYWTSHDSIGKIVDGIILAVNRHRSISPFIGKLLEHSARKGMQLGPELKEHPLFKLSSRERQLFYLIANGMKIEACAAEMNIAKRTTVNLREKLMKKFNVKSGTELVWKAIIAGLVDPFAVV